MSELYYAILESAVTAQETRPISVDERDLRLLTALQEISTEIRALRVTLVSAIQPPRRDSEGNKLDDAFLRTKEQVPGS